MFAISCDNKVQLMYFYVEVRHIQVHSTVHYVPGFYCMLGYEFMINHMTSNVDLLYSYKLLSVCYVFALCVDNSCSDGCYNVLAVDSIGCFLFCAPGTHAFPDTLSVTTWQSLCYVTVRPIHKSQLP